MHRAALALVVCVAGCGQSAQPRPSVVAETRASACDGELVGQSNAEIASLSAEPEWGARVVSVELAGLHELV